MSKDNGTMRRIPETSIRRLPAYLRALFRVGADRITSDTLGQAAGYSSEQVRKDLAYFGAFGTRGVGYDVVMLRDEIRRILRLDQGVRAVVVGAGRLGTALVRYTDESARDVTIAAVVDVNPSVVGTRMGQLTVEAMDHLEQIVAERNIGMGVITVPAQAAMAVCERLVGAGVRAILNFAPATLTVADPTVVIQQIDLTLEMQALAYFAHSAERVGQ
ncbi:MAG: redox-sensing transcriptional repressor Rex [Thermaerobacter sp.]|nr:redox-sensing transcriptional repressor Rex [Thermaerobacter sp.]